MSQLLSYMIEKTISFLQKKKKTKKNRYKQSALLEDCQNISAFICFVPILLSSSLGLFFFFQLAEVFFVAEGDNTGEVYFFLWHLEMCPEIILLDLS